MTGQGKSAIDTLLAESFKELALKQPIEKITIKEITDKAGVIRPTFYNHFQDKYDLLEWIIDKELLEPVEPLIQNGMINEALVLLFGSIERDKEFYTRAACAATGHQRTGGRQKEPVRVADAGAYRGVLCAVHVLCGDYLDQVRNDDFIQGTCRNL